MKKKVELLKIIFEALLHKYIITWANCFMLRKNLSWLQYRKEEIIF